MTWVALPRTGKLQSWGVGIRDARSLQRTGFGHQREEGSAISSCLQTPRTMLLQGQGPSHSADHGKGGHDCVTGSGGRGKGSQAHKASVGTRPSPRGSWGRPPSEKTGTNSPLLCAILGVFLPSPVLSMRICGQGKLFTPIGP